SIGDRWYQEFGAAESICQHRLDLDIRQFGNCKPADQMFRELLRGHFIQPWPDRFRCAATYNICSEPAIEDEVAGFLALQNLREQVMKLKHLNASLLHLQDEVIMVLLRFLDPDDVIEKQVLAISRCESLMRQTWVAHHNRAELSDLGMNANV